MSSTQAPLELLLAYQQRVLDIRADIPVIQDEREEWAGLAFHLGGAVYIAPMSEVDEIVDLPECARVPNTRPWFLGVGNVRGNLIPITDLHRYVFGSCDLERRNARVLTCTDGESTAGIMVDEILGLRRFYIDEQVQNDGGCPAALQSFVSHTFQRDEHSFPVFQIKQFINGNEFLQIAR